MVQAILVDGDVTLSVQATSTTTLGQAATLDAHLQFADQEEAVVSVARLTVTKVGSSTATLVADLPLGFTTSSQSTMIDLAATGTLDVARIFIDVREITSASSTLPGGTLPGGGIFKGIATTTSEISYTIDWNIPNDSAFLGDYEAKLEVHVVGPGGGNVIKSNTVAFSVFQPTVATELVALELGYNLISTPVEFESTTTSSDLLQQIADQGGSAPIAVSWDTSLQDFVFNPAGSAAGRFDVVPGLGFFVFVAVADYLAPEVLPAKALDQMIQRPQQIVNAVLRVHVADIPQHGLAPRRGPAAVQVQGVEPAQVRAVGDLEYLGARRAAPAGLELGARLVHVHDDVRELARQPLHQEHSAIHGA